MEDNRDGGSIFTLVAMRHILLFLVMDDFLFHSYTPGVIWRPLVSVCSFLFLCIVRGVKVVAMSCQQQFVLRTTMLLTYSLCTCGLVISHNKCMTLLKNSLDRRVFFPTKDRPQIGTFQNISHDWRSTIS